MKSLCGLNLNGDNASSNAGSSGTPAPAQVNPAQVNPAQVNPVWVRKLHLTSRSPRHARQSGNAILEGALILLPMLALFLGIIDISFAVFIQSTLTSAAREGTRFAITYGSSFNGNSCATSQAACDAAVVQFNAVGLPHGLASSYITVNYYTTNDLSHPVEACSNGSCSTAVCTVSTCTLPQTLSNGTVVNYANQPGNVVQIVIAGFPWNWMAPMKGYYAGSGLTLGASSVDVLGGLAVGVSVPPNP
jgi:Flp pilus assembly protein TadG